MAAAAVCRAASLAEVSAPVTEATSFLSESACKWPLAFPADFVPRPRPPGDPTGMVSPLDGGKDPPERRRTVG